jgi:branched-chain amino acid transport system permease protein
MSSVWTSPHRRVAAALQQTSAVSTAVLGVVLVLTLATATQRTAVAGFGLVAGCSLGLQALGVVLVYRSSRVVNFAQVQLAAVTSVLFGEILRHHAILRVTGFGCDGCTASPTAAAVEYWVALAGTLLVAPLLGLVVYFGLIRPLARASRLVGTVATLAAATVLAYAAELIATAFDKSGGGLGAPPDTRPPIGLPIHLGTAVVLNLGSWLTVAVAGLALGLITLFLRRARMGRAIRAAADNEDRARSLGIGPVGVQAVVWMIAGLLSGLGAILDSMATGVGGGGGATVPVIVTILAAAVLASLDSLPLALLGAVVLGILQQAVIAGNVDQGLRDLVVFAIVVAVLLLRPREVTGRLAAAAGAWATSRETRPIPAALRDLPPVRRLRLGTSTAVAIIALSLPWVLSPGSTSQASQLLVYAIVGLSLLILSGWTGQISLGQFGLAGVGAWVAAWLAGNAGLPFWLTVPTGAIAGTLAALLVGLPALRIRGLYLAITTLAFAQVAQTLLFGQKLGATLIPTHLDRPSILGLDGGDERAFYYLMLVIAGACALAVMGLRRSRTGRALIASRENEQATQAFGVNLTRARLQAFVVSGFFAALGGALFAYQVGGASGGGFTPEFSERLFLMTVVGGLGAVAGPFLGAVFMALAIGIVDAGSGSAAIVAGAAIILLLAAPGGMAQVVASVRDSFLRRVADRYHVEVPAFAHTGADDDGRARLAPKRLGSGATEFVPRRYRLDRRPPLPARSGTGR